MYFLSKNIYKNTIYCFSLFCIALKMPTDCHNCVITGYEQDQPFSTEEKHVKGNIHSM